MLAIYAPQIDPYIIRFGELGITWYSLSYVVGIVIAWRYCNYLLKITSSPINEKQIDDVVTWMIIAIVVGGRLGHVFLYEPLDFLQDPITIFQTYKGGMSFHGGFIGVGIASYLFCKKYKINIFNLWDLLAVVAPIGLMLGRIANFINGELLGKVTTMSWGVIFTDAGPLPRHPSQLYEAMSEGLILLLLQSYFVHNKNYYSKKGFLTGTFLIGYSVARYICEIFKEPDFEVLGITSGQLYSIPMLVIGIYFINNAYGNKNSTFSGNS